MIKFNHFVFIFLLFLSSAFSLHTLAETTLSGFLKLHVLNERSAFDSRANHELFQINRVSIHSTLTQTFSFEASYELTQIYTHLNAIELKEAIQQTLTSIKETYRLKDFQSTLLKNQDNYFLQHNLDRFFFTNDTETYRITIGRQPLAFGSGRTVNPTDVFTPFSFTAIDTEVRNGIDMVRFRSLLGEMGQFDLGILFGKNAKTENSAIYITAKISVDDFEIQPMLSFFKKADLIGLDLNTTVLGATLWLENAWVRPPKQASYFRSVFGTERQIDPNTSLFLEYYFNGAGNSNPAQYINLSSKFAYRNGSVYLLGKNYFNIGSNFQLTPLHQLSTEIKINIDDGSLFLASILEWNIFENFYFNLGAFLSIGKSSHSITTFQSEFGSIPTLIFTRFRYYF